MAILSDIAAVYENGVLRPDTELGLVEHARVLISIRPIDEPSEAQNSPYTSFHDIRERGEFRLNGWRPTRDELHERR